VGVAVHWPAPLQAQVLRAASPAPHDAAEHVVPAGWRVHWPAPSQTPVVPQVDTGMMGQRVSPMPPGIGMQLPTCPISAHDRHGPQEASGQQYPSVQWPLMHSVLRVHAALSGRRLVQEPARQL